MRRSPPLLAPLALLLAIGVAACGSTRRSSGPVQGDVLYTSEALIVASPPPVEEPAHGAARDRRGHRAGTFRIPWVELRVPADRAPLTEVVVIVFEDDDHDGKPEDGELRYRHSATAPEGARFLRIDPFHVSAEHRRQNLCVRVRTWSADASRHEYTWSLLGRRAVDS